MKLPAHTHSILFGAMLVIALAGCGKSPDEYVQDGKASFEKGDFKTAIVELKSALQEQPGNREARLLLGKAYLAQRAYANAEKELIKAREQGASQDEVLPALAKAYLNQRQPEKVVEMSLPSSVLDPKSVAAVQTLRAEAFLSMNRLDDAQIAINLAERANPDHQELLLLKARIAGGQANFVEAYRLIDIALAANAKLVEGYYYKAVFLESEGKYDQAARVFQEALKINPKDWRSHLALSNLYFQLGQDDAGLKSLQAAEAIESNLLLVRYSRGIYELRKNNLQAAHEAMSQVLRALPDYVPAQLASAMANLGLGNHEMSLKLAQSVLSRQPDNVFAARIVAASQIQAGDPKDALQTLAPFLKVNTDNAHLLMLAGEASYRNREFQQADKLFRQAEALAPAVAEIKIKQAASLLALGRSEEAVAELEKAAALSDNLGRSDIALVTLSLERKEFDKALQMLNKLERKTPNSALVHNFRAIALLGKKDLAGARQSLERAVATDPKFFPAIANLARFDLSDNRPDLARLRFEQLLKQDKDNLQAMMALAELSLTEKKNKDHISWLEKAIKSHPQALLPRTELSRYYLTNGENAKAISIARDALKINPNDADALKLLGAIQMASKDVKSGVATFKALAQKFPDSAEAHLRLGLAEESANNLGAARDSVNTALRLKPDSLEAMDALHRLAMKENKPDIAMQWIKKMQATTPSSFLGHEREGDVLITQKRYDAAAQAYQVAVDKGAGTAVFIKLHSALNWSGKGKTAQAKLEDWLASRPGDLMARAYAGGQDIKSGKYKSAIAHFEEILRLSPSDAMAQNNLASLYHHLRDPRALAFAEQAYKNLPGNPVVQDTLGWILLDQGQSKRALELLAKSVEKLDTNPTVQYHYAVALGRNGNKQKAKELLQKITAANVKFAEMEEAKAYLKTLD
jgi:putative PEP-CTERM system TPR-repeat lipoprotein